MIILTSSKEWPSYWCSWDMPYNTAMARNISCKGHTSAIPYSSLSIRSTCRYSWLSAVTSCSRH